MRRVEFTPCPLVEARPSQGPPPSAAAFAAFDGRYSTIGEWLSVSGALDASSATAECGAMKVPAAWSEPEGDSIDVFVKRYPAKEQPAKGQLWMLQGGPGLPGSKMDSIAFLIAPSLPAFDIYVPDHRGTGKSTLAECAEGLAPAECAASVPHLGGLTVTDAARDVAALIDATRTSSQQTFVYGQSYGTYWALRYLQVRPEQPTAVILDSTVAIGTDWKDFDRHFDDKAHAVLDLCKADATCSAKLGPDPLATAMQVVAAYPAACSAYGTNLRSVFGEFVVGGDYFARLLLPAIAYRLSRCNDTDLTWLDKVYGYLLRQSLQGKGTSGVVFNNIVASELWLSTETAAQIKAEAESMVAKGGSEGLADVVLAWPEYPRDEYFGEWPSSPAPTLVLQGGLDARTPYGDMVKQHYSSEHQYYVEMPTATHGLLSPLTTPMADLTLPGCGWQVMESFLSDPKRAPDTSCIAGMMPIDFGSPPPEWMSVVGIQDLWENP